MNNSHINPTFIYLSLGLHVLIIVVANSLGQSTRIHKKFTVYGAHSKNNGKTIYRTTTIPVVTEQRTAMTTGIKQPHKQAKKQATTKIKSKKSVIKKQSSKKKERIQPIANTTKKKQRKQKKQAPEPPKIEPIGAEKPVTQPPAPEPAPPSTEPSQSPEPARQELTTQETEQPGLYDLTTEQESDELAPLRTVVVNEVTRTWNPSIGVPKNTEAILELTIDTEGTVSSYIFLQKSGILIFDKSIIMAIKQMNFKPFICDKRITIRFRQ